MPTSSLPGLLPLEAAIQSVFMFFLWPDLPRQVCSPGVLFPHHLQPLTLAVTSSELKKGVLYTLWIHRSWLVPRAVSRLHKCRGPSCWTFLPFLGDIGHSWSPLPIHPEPFLFSDSILP